MPGPIFHSVVLADEINRAPPKTQSALLEAMEERQVSQDGQTRKLPDPFFVIATQNPVEQIGAYPLPESQLDRFLHGASSSAIPMPRPSASCSPAAIVARSSTELAPLCDPATLAAVAARSRRDPRRARVARLRAGAARRVARPPGRRHRATPARGAA